MLASYGAIIVMAAAGALSRRSDKLLRASLNVRTAFGLAVVFVMIAKPDAALSWLVLGLAFVSAAFVSVPKQRSQRVVPSRA